MSNSKPIIVSLMNTKGGTGKTTIIQLIATHINYYYPNINIKLIDSDAGTKTTSHLRSEDMAIIEDYLVKYPTSKIAKIYNELSAANSVYPIELQTSKQIKEEYAKMNKPNYPFDIVFIDTPGAFSSEAFQTTLAICDYIFIPTKPYEKEIVTTVEFYVKVEKLKLDGQLPNLKYLSIFINDISPFIKVDSVVERIDETYLQYCKEAGINKAESDINILENTIPRKNDIAQSILTSIVPIAPENKANHYMKEFVSELETIIPNLKN